MVSALQPIGIEVEEVGVAAADTAGGYSRRLCSALRSQLPWGRAERAALEKARLGLATTAITAARHLSERGLRLRVGHTVVAGMVFPVDRRASVALGCRPLACRLGSAVYPLGPMGLSADITMVLIA